MATLVFTDDSSKQPTEIQPKKVKGVGFGVDILAGGAVKLRSANTDDKKTIEFSHPKTDIKVINCNES